MSGPDETTQEKYSKADFFMRKIQQSLARIVRAGGMDIDEFLQSVKEEYEADTVEVKPVVRSDELHQYLPMAMSLWHSIPEYCDDSGSPVSVSLQGEAPSFENLIERAEEFVGKPLENTDFAEIERLLLASECVRKDEDGQIHALRPDFRFSTDDALLPVTMLRQLSGFLATVAYNATKGQGGHFQSFAWSGRFPRKNIGLLKSEVHNKGMNFLVDADAFLMNHEDSEAEDQTFAGVGAYLYFDET